MRGLAIIDLETVPRGAVFGAPVSVPDVHSFYNEGDLDNTHVDA